MALFTAADFFPLHCCDELPEDEMQAGKTQEQIYSERLANQIDGARVEVKCKHGRIDVLAPNEVIGVKRLSDWKSALGQVLAYGFAYSNRAKRIHLLVPRGRDQSQLEKELRGISEVCRSVNVTVSAEYESDEEVVIKESLYTIGGEHFTDMDQIKDRIADIKKRFSETEPMDDKAEQFMIDLVNCAHWVEKRFGGKVTSARIMGKVLSSKTQRQSFSFQVKSSTGDWTPISIKNYLEVVEKLGDVTFRSAYRKAG